MAYAGMVYASAVLGAERELARVLAEISAPLESSISRARTISSPPGPLALAAERAKMPAGVRPSGLPA